MELLNQKTIQSPKRTLKQKERYIKEKRKLAIDYSLQSSQSYLFPDFETLCGKDNSDLLNIKQCNNNLRMY